MPLYQKINNAGNYNYNAMMYNNFDLPPNFHVNPELIYVIDGNLELEVNNRREEMTPGCFALILPNQIHSTHVPRSCSYWIGVFSRDFVYEFARFCENKTCNTSLFFCRPEIEAFLKHYLINTLHPDLFLLKSLLYAACNEFATTVPMYPKKDNKNESLLDFIINYVSAHYSEDLSLQEIAEHLGYEYHYLSRFFSNTVHTNFRVFLNQYRLEHAKTLMRDSRGKEVNISDIALESGFQSIRTFNRAFKKYTGIEPSRFLKDQVRHRESALPPNTMK